MGKRCGDAALSKKLNISINYLTLPKRSKRAATEQFDTEAQPALHFGEGGQISWNFIRWRHRVSSTVVQLFRKRSQIKFSSQHFRKWELFSYNQDADRTIKTE